MNEPRVTLVTATADPMLALYTGWEIMTSKNWEHVSEKIRGAEVYNRKIGWADSTYPITQSEFAQVLLQIADSPRQGVLEFVHFVFLLEGVSRALQQQLTRHRVGFSYSIQSLRMVDPGNFFDEGRYHIPEKIKDESIHSSLDIIEGVKKRTLFMSAMERIQKSHRLLIKVGFLPEDARGVLPLNIHSPISMGCTLLALKNMIGQILCPSTQGEFQEVATQIKKIVTDWESVLGDLLVPFCDKQRRCLVPETDCGRWAVD